MHAYFLSHKEIDIVIVPTRITKILECGGIDILISLFNQVHI
jgi:hypothetical protein